MSYKADNDYSVQAERGLIWNDKTLSIHWPKVKYIISKKVLELPTFKQAKKFE